MVRLIVAYGRPLAIALAALVPLSGLAMVICGWSWLVFPAAWLLGLIAWGLLQSYVEIIRIIADTLLPR